MEEKLHEVNQIMMINFLRMLTELSSRKWVSQLTGSFAKSSLSKIFIPKFAKVYGIRIDDAEKALTEYTSLNDFFTRRLKEGLRPIDPNEEILISPVDATITGMGPIDSGKMINVKGQDYTVKELLNHSPRMVNYKNGFYFVLYLSPTDYHRIHAPITGKITEKEHILGKVYPVNDFGLRKLPQVLSRNERLITYIRHVSGEIAVAKVGALNVSSIQYTDAKKMEIIRGDDLAYFEFGSTVVLLTESGTFECLHHLSIGKKVQMGEALGTLHTKNTNKGL